MKTPQNHEKDVKKENVLESIGADNSAFQKYLSFFVGNSSIWDLIQYELAHMLAAPMPGALGYVLRKALMTPLLGQSGNGVQIGRSVSIRHPGKIIIGDRTAIDDDCLLDARGIKKGEFNIGSDVLIARGSVLSSKTDGGFIELGNNVTIGKSCGIISTGGIRIGNWVGIADTAYLGGGRYRTENKDIPMLKQQLYTKGPVEIGDDCWIGMGVQILDGVKIGKGSIIGAGATVREDVPEYTMVTPHQRLVMLPRVTEDKTESVEN